VEGDARDVSRMALELQDGVRVGGLDIVELHGVVARGGEVALVGGNAEAVDLRFGVLDGARANAREGFPEARGRGAVVSMDLRSSVRETRTGRNIAKRGRL